MLAYVFWHWPRPGVGAADYRSRLCAFHEALRDSPSPGFIRSFTHAIRGAPWANDGGVAYEDWYLVESSAALDALNDAAISGARLRSHDEAAVRAAGGTAGLYRLRAGAAAQRPTHAHWFAKPQGMTYPELFSAVNDTLRPGRAGLWIRQMTLGPATECCLMGDPVEPPAPCAGTGLTLQPVWPPAEHHRS